MNNQRLERSFTEGPLFSKIFLYVIPIILSGFLQLCYNMADHVVVGQFSSDPHSLAAVGSTSALTSLVLNLVLGVAGGAGVAVAQSYGARDYRRLERLVHTSMTFSVISGILFMLIGLFVTAPALRLMGTNEDIFHEAVVYMQIICLGIPATAIYNFGAGIIRSVGDSRSPLYILATTGIINVFLNVVFVVLCDMTADGVAYATIISQYISAAAVVYILIRRKNEVYGLNVRSLRIDRGSLSQMLRYGVPAGIQGALFSFSNVLITSAINAFPSSAIDAKTIATNIDSIQYNVLNSYHVATMTVCAQNYGANKIDRVKRSLGFAIIQTTAISLALAGVILLLGDAVPLIFISGSNPAKDEILLYSMQIISITVPLYFILGIEEALTGALRALGHSLLPMIIAVIGICGVRTAWIFLAVPMPLFNSPQGIYYSYPISWSVTLLALLFPLLAILRKLSRKAKATEDTPAEN